MSRKHIRFHDARATEEAVDKLVHRGTIITIKGPSYRLKEKLNQMGLGVEQRQGDDFQSVATDDFLPDGM